ncbi:MAG: topoisomerase DNA-binding C4 zinc finger domain-containing protein [Alteromonadaceae bacterium]|nr:topoisomerase DNA-binding C4 zinc finger domain-containing protein [Alteromonadaceae bacterium]
MSNSEQPLFSRHEHALEKSDQACPQCGGELIIKHGKSGAFFGCVNYPSCEFTQQINDHERVKDKVLAGSECPLCHLPLAVKQGRYGMFIGCTNYPECHYIDEEKAKDAGVSCPQCLQKNEKHVGELLEKISRYGKMFYACDRYPKCKYVVNYPPIQQNCPKCHWSILVKRTMAKGDMLVCPQKKCGYKEEKPI